MKTLNFTKGLLAIIFLLSPLSQMKSQAPYPQGPGPVTAINGQPVNPVQNPPQNPGPFNPPAAPGINQGFNPPQNPNPGAVPPPSSWGVPGTLVNPPTASWMNQGTMNVMATGYDAQGVMRQIPLNVSYSFNGVNYNVTVLSAWNPFTQMWNMGIDQPAFSTSYYLNGFTYNWYAPLSIGTFYFNL